MAQTVTFVCNTCGKYNTYRVSEGRNPRWCDRKCRGKSPKKLPEGPEGFKRAFYYDSVEGKFYRFTKDSFTEIIRKPGRKDIPYIKLTFNGKDFRAHIIAWAIMTGEMPTCQIDHINGQKDDNRWENLRLATNRENCCNKGPSKNNKSGYKGVSKKNKRSWVAVIHTNSRQIRLGTFSTPEEAAVAYNKAALKYHGEFAYINPIPIKGA